MPYKFKDDGSHTMKPFQRKIYFIIAVLIMAKSIANIIILSSRDWIDYTDIALGLFMIWGINRNGFYKIVRRYAEWNIKRKDNKWR